MNINELIFSSLETLETPIYFGYKHTSTREDIYIVFNVTSEYDTNFADNKNEAIKYRILFKIYAKGDYTDTFNILTKLLKQAGFIKGNSASNFDNEMLMYQKSVYFTKLILNTQELEEIQ